VNFTWDWPLTFRAIPALLSGLYVTVEATIIGMGVALVLGLLWAMLRRSTLRILSWPAGALVEFVRSTPLLVQLYFLFFWLPETGLRISGLATGILGLGLHYSAYTSEVYRAGINSVDRGQWEAARALNLSRSRTFLRIIFPQALRPIWPSLGNYLIAMFKDTPLLSAITVIDMLQAAKIIGSANARYLEPITLVGIFFLCLSLLSATLLQGFERIVRKGYPT
jgi:polar amino acid transport system permease protein